MSTDTLNIESSAEFRQTAGHTEPARDIAAINKRLNPTRVFVDKNRLAFFWFIVATLACIAAVVQPVLITRTMKARERVVIVDPAGTYYVSPVLEFQEARHLHAQQATLATLAFLERNPKDFDHPELLKQVFLKAAEEKAKKHRNSQTDEFKAKQLHQKPEVGRIDILETRQDYVLAQVTGQLIRTGIFNGKAFSEAVPFKLVLQMTRNPDMTQNGRFPTAVRDFRYETTSQK